MILNVRDFGAIGNGVADDTAAIQAALNVLSRNEASGSWPVTGGVYFPLGAYRVTSPRTYIGNPGHGLRLLGDIGGTRGPCGSRLIWDGPAGWPMLWLRGANGLTVEHMEFRGAPIHCEAYWPASPTIAFTGSSGLTFRSCTFSQGGLHVGSENTPGGATYQCSEIAVHDCQFLSCEAGFRTKQSGNTKNISLWACNFSDCGVGVDLYPGSGSAALYSPTFGNVGTCLRKGVAAVTVIDLRCESDAAHPCRMVDASGGGANPSQLNILGGYWHAHAPADDCVILCQGQLRLQGVDLWNMRASGALPKIRGNGLPPGSIGSENNTYRNAVAYAPFYDGSGNDLLSTDPSSYARTKQFAILSRFDYGGPTGQKLLPFRCGMTQG